MCSVIRDRWAPNWDGGFFLGRGTGVIQKGKGPPYTQVRGPGSVLSCLPVVACIHLPFIFFKLYVYVLYTLICYIFPNLDTLLKLWAKSQTYFLQYNSPPSLIIILFFLSKLPLPVLKCFHARKGGGGICHTAPPSCGMLFYHPRVFSCLW